MNEATGISIYGTDVSKHLFANVNDFDYERLYPNAIDKFNIGHGTLKGRVIMSKDNISERELRVVDARYDRGGKFIDDIEVNEPTQICFRWLNLPSLEDVINGFADENNLSRLHKIKVRNKPSDLRKIEVKRIG